jgi:bacillithiol system protein YtxJ
MNWLQLIAEEQLMDINLLSERSDVKAVIILKHSTRCAISSMALSRLERNWRLPEKEVPAYFLDLLSYRDLSNKIANKYAISHESPQVLVIKNGKCIYTASHSDINALDIETIINS